MGVPSSCPLRVTASIPRCTAGVRTVAIGRLRGSARSARGTCTSLPGVSTWAATTGTMGLRCAGFVGECRIYLPTPTQYQPNPMLGLLG